MTAIVNYNLQRLFVDMDGTLAVFTPVNVLEHLYEPGFFGNSKPIDTVVEAIKQVIRGHPEIEVNILSAYLTDSPYALVEKNAWLDQFLPEIDQEHRIFLPCGSNKKDFIKGGIQPNDYLIDDYTQNLLNWRLENGIKLLNGINHTHGTWRYSRLRFDKSPVELASNIVDIIQRGSMIMDQTPTNINQEEGNVMNANIMKHPHIVGYYKQSITTKEAGVVKVIPAVMLQYPDGNQQLTTGLLYSTPSEEYMNKWKAVEHLGAHDLCAMQNTILNAIRADPLFDIPENRFLIQLLQAETSENTFSVYQLKNSPDMKDFRFQSLNQLPAGSSSVNPENYDFVYTAPLTGSTTLEDIYSVSDIVVLHQNGKNSAYYVDSIGFKALPEFHQNSLTDLDPIWAARNLNPPEGSLCRALVYNAELQADEWTKGEIVGIHPATNYTGWRYDVATKEAHYEDCHRNCIQLDQSMESGFQYSVLEKLNRMQQETGARPFLFTAGEEPLVSLPAEADDYLTPQEKKEAVDLISKQSEWEQQPASGLDTEPEETDIQDFEEDFEMNMTT